MHTHNSIQDIIALMFNGSITLLYQKDDSND